MKKLLAIVLCVCIALTLSVSVLAESSPQNTIIIRRGVGTKQDGSNIPQDTFVEVAANNTVTVKANEKTYGKFNSWTIYVVTDDGEYVEAEEGVDFEIVNGSLDSTTLTFKSLSDSPLTVAGNYNGEITDPSGASVEVMVKKGAATVDGEEVPENEYFEIAVGGTVDLESVEDYGEFDSWSIYVISEAETGTAGAAKILNLAKGAKATAAKAGTDYEVTDGSLTSDTLSVKLIKEEKIVICGNYDGKTTDPLSGSASVDGSSTSPKTSDIAVICTVFALFAAGAIVFGAKKQFSK